MNAQRDHGKVVINMCDDESDFCVEIYAIKYKYDLLYKKLHICITITAAVGGTEGYDLFMLCHCIY